MKKTNANWFGLGLDAFQLGVDASQVVAMRTAKIAMGGAAAQRESQLMVSEKLVAMFDLQTAFMTGRAGSTPHAVARSALSHYGRKVRANRRRLSKSN